MPSTASPRTTNALFRAFDVNGSGSIDKTELTNGLNKIGLTTDEKQAALILSKYDADHNGTLEPQEFFLLDSDLRDFQAATAKAQVQSSDAILQSFRAFDSDHSNSIESGELCTALNAFGMTSDEATAEQILRKYDVDGNGRLDADEWRNLTTDLRAFRIQGRARLGGGVR